MTAEQRQEWTQHQKDESKSLPFVTSTVNAKKQRMIDAILTGQKIAIDIHYQDQMNSVVKNNSYKLNHRSNTVLSANLPFVIKRIRMPKRMFPFMCVELYNRISHVMCRPLKVRRLFNQWVLPNGQ